MAKKISYLDNIKKEMGDFGRAYKRTGIARGELGAGTDSKATRLRQQQDRALLQLAASFIGNQYDAKGRRKK